VFGSAFCILKRTFLPVKRDLSFLHDVWKTANVIELNVKIDSNSRFFKATNWSFCVNSKRFGFIFLVDRCIFLYYPPLLVSLCCLCCFAAALVSVFCDYAFALGWRRKEVGLDSITNPVAHISFYFLRQLLLSSKWIVIIYFFNKTYFILLHFFFSFILFLKILLETMFTMN
jgi:hypothetical protein